MALGRSRMAEGQQVTQVAADAGCWMRLSTLPEIGCWVLDPPAQAAPDSKQSTAPPRLCVSALKSTDTETGTETVSEEGQLEIAAA
jgi:hypothetical protein